MSAQGSSRASVLTASLRDDKKRLDPSASCLSTVVSRGTRRDSSTCAQSTATLAVVNAGGGTPTTIRTQQQQPRLETEIVDHETYAAYAELVRLAGTVEAAVQAGATSCGDCDEAG